LWIDPVQAGTGDAQDGARGIHSPGQPEAG
jgi:hypothetical protein